MPAKKTAKKTSKRKAAKRRIGRPSTYSASLVRKFLDRVSAGRMVTDVCSDKDMPSSTTVYRWEQEKPEFRESFVRAREACAHALASQALQIADETPSVATGAPGTGEAGARVNANKIRIDVRLKLAGLINPKHYAETKKNEHSGPDGGPIQSEGSVTITPDIEKRIRAIAATRAKMEKPAGVK